MYSKVITLKTIIRKRKMEDSLELANCIATVWNTTYKEIVDDDFLKGLLDNVQGSAEKLRNNLNNQPNYYVLTLQEKIIGWIYYELDSDKYDGAAEIHSLYVLKEYQGKGYGQKLYNYAVKKIRKKGIKKLVIGCLDGNPSNNFYKHLGGKYIGKHLFREKYKENFYLFEL